MPKEDEWVLITDENHDVRIVQYDGYDFGDYAREHILAWAHSPVPYKDWEVTRMIVILNTVVLLCFTALAIHFEKWWIVLFACFFLFSKKTIQEEDNEKENKYD